MAKQDSATLTERLRPNAKQVDLGLRLIFGIAAIQCTLGIAYGLAHASEPYVLPYAIFTLIYLGSGCLIFFRQPQFAALFALLGTASAQIALDLGPGLLAPSLWLLVPTLFWLLSFEHPTKASNRLLPLLFLGTLGSLTTSLLLLFGFSSSLLWPVWTLLLIGALILITQRCIAEGLHKSPRTLVLLAGFAPTAACVALQSLGLLDNAVGDVAGWSMMIAAAFAPIGALLNEVSLNRRTERSLHERQENA